MRRWQRPGLGSDPETVLNLTLTERVFVSSSRLRIGSSLEYQHLRQLTFEGRLDSNTWLVVDKFEDRPREGLPWQAWIDSAQLRRPKVEVLISERRIDSSMDPKEDWFFTLIYEDKAVYPDMFYPERLDVGLIVEPEMFNELLSADMTKSTVTVSLTLSDQFESFLEWNEIEGTVIGWDVSQGSAIRLDKYGVSIRTKTTTNAEPAKE